MILFCYTDDYLTFFNVNKRQIAALKNVKKLELTLNDVN